MSSSVPTTLSYEVEGVNGLFSSTSLALRVVSGLTDGLSNVRVAGSTDPWRQLGDITEIRAIIGAALSAANDEDYDESDDSAEPERKTGVALFFYADAAGARQGPVALDAAASLWDAGYLTGASLVWTPGAAEWAPLETVGVLLRAAKALVQVPGRKRSRSADQVATLRWRWPSKRCGRGSSCS